MEKEHFSDVLTFDLSKINWLKAFDHKAVFYVVSC